MGALADFLLAAPAERPAAQPVAVGPPVLLRGAGVLAAEGDALAAGAAAAAALARRARYGLVCVHDPGADVQGLRALAARAARRLAATLTTRGHDATASGRLAIVALDADPVVASGEAARAIAAARDAAVVLALGGARDEAFDPLLRDRDLVLVALRDAPGSGALAALAVAGAEALGIPAARFTPARSPFARALAASGLAAPAQLREILEHAVAPA